MTVTLATVRGWRPEALRGAAQSVGRHLHTVVEVGDRLERRGTPADWSGDAAQAASADLGRLQTGLRELAHDAAAVREAATEAATEVTAVQGALADAETVATENGLKIGRSGEIVVVVPATDPASAARQRAAEAWLRTRVAQIVRTASDLDTKLAAVLRGVEKTSLASLMPIPVGAAAASGTADGRLSPPSPPKGGHDPEANAAWWATLSSGERAALIRAHPERIGNMNGLPAAVRSRVNEARLPEEKARLQQQLTRAKAYLERLRHEPGLLSSVTGPLGQLGRLLPGRLGDIAKDAQRLVENGEPAVLVMQGVVDKLQAKVDSLSTIQKVMGQDDRQLLLLDTGGRRVKAAVAVGDVDTADNVAVYTPGFNSTVDGSLKGYDKNMNQLLAQADHFGGTNAAVTWIGYEAPQTGEIFEPGHTVLGSGDAETGGRALNEFYRGINASRVQDPHLVALGHSYGSTTTAYALRSPSGVDDAVLFGSPGFGEGVHTAGDLQVPAGHVHLLEAQSDWIADTGKFGGDPSWMPGVDNMSTHPTTLPDGTHLDGSYKHSEYLWNHTTSQYNMAAILSGHPELVVR